MNTDHTVKANFELAAGLGVVEIPFNEGWNTFSTPISLHDCMDTWDEFIAANSLDIAVEGLDILMIYGYNAATGSWVTVDGGDEIEPLYGFYVKTTAAGMATIIPNSHVTGLPTRELSSGVHLIGPAPASLADVDVATALTTIYEAENGHIGYTLVVSPYINPNDWDYVRDAPDPPDMGIGRAFWLVMENADQYVGSTTTPRAP